jgi:hypothetical protein
MTRSFLSAALLCWFALDLSRAFATPQESNQALYGYYLYDGRTLQVVDEDPGRSQYGQWEVWLFPQNVRISDGLPYARWGAVQAPSARAVMKQLPLWQKFERAYAKFFGPAAWGRLTFSHPVGPIAVPSGMETRDASALIAEADDLNRRISAVIAAILPSLENNQNSDPPSPAAGYFGQVRDCLQGVVKFYDQVARLPGQPGFLKLQLARLRDEVHQAEDAASKITTFFPSVKLPAAKGWMTQTDYQGSDGTVETTIAEIDSAVRIRRAWSGGDGSMTGTVVVTIVPYKDIGSVQVIAAPSPDPSKWTLSIRMVGRAGFLQSVMSPARTTSTRSFAPVDLTVNEPFLFLDFSSASDAQDAYAFFVYHKQLGR